MFPVPAKCCTLRIEWYRISTCYKPRAIFSALRNFNSRHSNKMESQNNVFDSISGVILDTDNIDLYEKKKKAMICLLVFQLFSIFLPVPINIFGKSCDRKLVNTTWDTIQYQLYILVELFFHPFMNGNEAFFYDKIIWLLLIKLWVRPRLFDSPPDLTTQSNWNSKSGLSLPLTNWHWQRLDSYCVCNLEELWLDYWMIVKLCVTVENLRELCADQSGSSTLNWKTMGAMSYWNRKGLKTTCCY